MAASNDMAFLDLPMDMIQHTFRLLQYRHLANCACANKFLNLNTWNFMERFNQRFELYQTDDVEDEEPAQVGATVTIVDKKRRAAALQANFSSLSKANNLVHLVLADISKWSVRPEQLPQVFTKLSSLRLVQFIDAFSEEEGTQGSVINQLTTLTKLTLERRAIERPIFPALTSLRHLDVDMEYATERARSGFLLELGVYSRLRFFCVGFVTPTPAELDALCRHPTLETILCHLDVAGFEYLSKKPPRQSLVFLDRDGRPHFAAVHENSPAAAIELWKNFPSVASNPNTKDIYGYTSLHLILFGQPQVESMAAILQAGADANTLMPTSSLDSHDIYIASLDHPHEIGFLPVSFALATRAPPELYKLLWAATKDLKAGSVSPHLAAIMSADYSIADFVFQRIPVDVFEPFYCPPLGVLEQTCCFLEAVMLDSGPALVRLMESLSNADLEAHADDIRRYLAIPEEEEVLSAAQKLFLVMRKCDSATNEPPYWRPMPKRNLNEYASKVLQRLQPYFPDLWLARSDESLPPLSCWLEHKNAPFLPWIKIDPSTFLKQCKGFSPAALVTAVHDNPHHSVALLKEIAAAAQTPEALAEAAALMPHPLQILYMLLGCPGDTLRLRMPETSDIMSQLKMPKEFMGPVFNRICQDADPHHMWRTNEAVQWFELLFRLDLPGSKSPLFALQLFKKPCADRNDGALLRFLECGCDLSHPELLDAAVVRDAFRSARYLLKHGTNQRLRSPVSCIDVLTMETANFVVDCVRAGSDPNLVNAKSHTLLEAIYNAKSVKSIENALKGKDRVSIIHNLVKLGAKPPQDNLDLVAYALQKTDNIAHIRSLLEQVPKGLSSDFVWYSLASGSDISFPDFALGPLADLFAEFEVQASRPRNFSTPLKRIPTRVLKALSRPCYDSSIPTKKFRQALLDAVFASLSVVLTLDTETIEVLQLLLLKAAESKDETAETVTVLKSLLLKVCSLPRKKWDPKIDLRVAAALGVFNGLNISQILADEVFSRPEIDEPLLDEVRLIVQRRELEAEEKRRVAAKSSFSGSLFASNAAPLSTSSPITSSSPFSLPAPHAISAFGSSPFSGGAAAASQPSASTATPFSSSVGASPFGSTESVAASPFTSTASAFGSAATSPFSLAPAPHSNPFATSASSSSSSLSSANATAFSAGTEELSFSSSGSNSSISRRPKPKYRQK